MLIFECPSCKAKMQASEEYAGKTTACPECGAATKIPASVETPAGAITADPDTMATASPPSGAITTPEQARASKRAHDDAGDDDDDRPRRRDRSSSRGEATAVGMGIGMVLLLVFGAGGCVLLGVVAILIALLVPAVQKVREAAARAQTMNNMKQIALADLGHHDAFRFLPSPKMQPMPPAMNAPDLSWRVSILPFVDQGAMFNVFDRNIAWDHAKNQPFLNSRPPVYQNVMHPDADMTQTTFQYFTGPKTMFPDPLTKINMADIKDGTSNTFLFAEAANGVPWTKPADMAVAPIGPLPLLPERFLAAMADGSVRLVIRSGVNDATLRLLIDPNDGQALPPGAFD
jgi:Protein of unknown function (DUF1559)